MVGKVYRAKDIDIAVLTLKMSRNTECLVDSVIGKVSHSIVQRRGLRSASPLYACAMVYSVL